MSQEPSNSASLARVVEEDVVESPAKRARTEEAAVNADESESPAPKDADTKSSGDEGSDSGEEKGQCWECKDEDVEIAQNCPRCKQKYCEACAGFDNAGCDCGDDLCRECRTSCASCDQCSVCEDHGTRCEVCGMEPLCSHCGPGGVHADLCDGKQGEEEGVKEDPDEKSD